MWKRRGRRRIARSLKAGRCRKPLRQGQAVEADASILSSWPPAASLPVVVVDWAINDHTHTHTEREREDVRHSSYILVVWYLKERGVPVTVRPVVTHRRLAAEDLVAAKSMPNWTSSAALV
jgi:hypothetical protein